MSLLLERELIITSSSISIFFCLFKFEILTKSVHRIFLFHFLFPQQVTAASIDMIPRHSFSRWLTSQYCILPAYRNYGNALYDCSSYGPTFGGGHDLYIDDYASSNSNSHTALGHTYSPPSGYSYGSTSTYTFLAGTYTFTPDEVETFYETT